MRADAAGRRFCERFDVEYPIVNAPMAFVAGGRLASAVSCAGGLGVVGGGYGDLAWIEEQLERCGRTPVGVGVITWALATSPQLLDGLIELGVRTVVLSFGDPTTATVRLCDAGVRVICQVQNADDASRAVAAGADAVVAQGAESGGHGAGRSPLNRLLPTVLDVAGTVPVLAAGGIVTRDDVARARSTGAAGVMVGTRFYATSDSLDTEEAKRRLVDSDETIRTSVFDAVRGPAWPEGFDGRALTNDLTRRWQTNGSEIRRTIDVEHARYAKAVADDDLRTRVVWAGAAVGAVEDLRSAEAVVHDLAAGLA